MSLVVFSTIAFATVITSFISGILGMAGGMILMGVLIALLPVSAAMMLHGITQFAANGWRAWMLRGAIDWRIFRGYAAGSLAALAIFAIAQWVVSKPVALLMLGVMPFLTLALPENLKLNVERRGHSTACGFICAGLALVAGVSGPILDVFFVRSRMGRHAVVATKASSQTLTHLLKIIYFGGVLATGASGEVAPLEAVTMIGLAFLGTTLSKQVLERIDDASFRAWTRWTVMSVGGVYLASGITMILK
jgi:uncharacterized membrane protein YfcA